MSKTTYHCVATPEDAVDITMHDRDGVAIRTRLAPGRAIPYVCLSPNDATDLHRRLGEYLGIAPAAPAPHLENARFEDVHVGDRVRIEYGDGDAFEATVGRADGRRIGSTSGITVATKRIEGDFTITILSRPTPQLPTEPRSVILVEADGDWVPMILDADGDWAAFSKTGREGYWSSVDIAARDWKLAKVVEA